MIPSCSSPTRARRAPSRASHFEVCPRDLLRFLDLGNPQAHRPRGSEGIELAPACTFAGAGHTTSEQLGPVPYPTVGEVEIDRSPESRPPLSTTRATDDGRERSVAHATIFPPPWRLWRGG